MTLSDISNLGIKSINEFEIPLEKPVLEHPFNDFQTMMLRKIYLAKEDFIKKIEKGRKEYEDKIKKCCSGIRTNGYPCIFDLKDYIYGKGFSEREINWFKDLDRYSFRVSKSMVDVLFPDEWYDNEKDLYTEYRKTHENPWRGMEYLEEPTGLDNLPEKALSLFIRVLNKIPNKKIIDYE